MVISFPSKIPCLSYHHNYRKLDILSDTNEQQGGAASGTHGRTFSEDGGGDHREGPHTKIIRDAKKDKKPKAKEFITNLEKFYGQHFADFAVKENCLWMEGDSQYLKPWQPP